MNEIDYLDEKTTLQLHAQGKDAWNKYMRENPDTNVKFEGEISNCDFSGYRFKGITSFKEVIFRKKTKFYNAIFDYDVDFSGSKFMGSVNFDETIFHKVNFFEAIFDDKRQLNHKDIYELSVTSTQSRCSAFFRGTTFLDKAIFIKARFVKDAAFRSVNYHKETFFDDAEFHIADFEGHRISENSLLLPESEELKFRGVSFKNTKFFHINFIEVIFDGKTIFTDAVFHSANFLFCHFKYSLNFVSVFSVC